METRGKWPSSSTEIGHRSYKIEQRITVANSPSVILEGIQRYFDKRGRHLHLIVPLKDIGMPGTLALERQVTVELKTHPNMPVDQGRLDFRWVPAGETSPTFIGSLAVRPLGTETELILSGDYQPPFEGATAEFGVVFDDETAQGTGRLLLEELKAVLETETDAVTEFDRSHSEELERGGVLPHVGWKAAREHFW